MFFFPPRVGMRVDGGGFGEQGTGLDVNGQEFQKRACGEERAGKNPKTVTPGGELTPNRST